MSAISATVITLTLLVFLLTIAATLAAVFTWTKLSFYKGKAEQSTKYAHDCINRLLAVEQQRVSATEELNAIKTALSAIQQKPLIATLSDEQATQLMTTISSMVQQALDGNDPSRLN